MASRLDVIDEFIVKTVLDDSGVAQGFEVIGKKQKEVIANNKKVEASNKKVEKSFKAIKKQGFEMGRAFRFLGAMFAVDKLVQYSDEFTKLNNILMTMTSNDKERVALGERLFRITQKTRTAMGDTIGMYGALTDSGLSARQAGRGTEVINKAIATAGGETRDRKAIERMIKTGKLQSLSMLSQNMAGIIASGMGMSLEELQKKVKKGGLTAVEVMKALDNQSRKIDKNFDKMGMTFSEAFSVLRTGIGYTVSKFNEMTGFSNGLAKSIAFLGENTKLLSNLMISGLFAGIARYLPTLKAGALAMKSFVLPFIKLQAVLMGIQEAWKAIKGEDNIFGMIGDWVGNYLSTSQTKNYSGMSFEERMKNIQMRRETMPSIYEHLQPSKQYNPTFNIVSNSPVATANAVESKMNQMARGARQ